MSFDRLFQDVISGRHRTPVHVVARLLLHGLSWPYRLAVSIRNALFDRGLRSVTRMDVPVISVGNITTGGTGKTPMAAAIVRMLLNDGHHPGIVSRGYRSDESGANDEKRVLEHLCPGVPHVQNPDRIAAAQQIITSHQVDCIVLDDAFQHRRIARDVNLVLIDATNPFGYGHLLPRGLLREPVTGLRRADMVVITRRDQVSSDVLHTIQRKIVQASGRPEERIVAVSFQPTHWLDAKKNRGSLADLTDRSVMVMTAIGNPEGFVRTCEQMRANIVGTRFFADHHHYSAGDLLNVQQEANQWNADFVVTTLKDLVKIPVEFDCAVPIRAIEIATHFETPAAEERLKKVLLNVFRQSSSQSG